MSTLGEDGHLQAKEGGSEENPANTLVLDIGPPEL